MISEIKMLRFDTRVCRNLRVLKEQNLSSIATTGFPVNESWQESSSPPGLPTAPRGSAELLTVALALVARGCFAIFVVSPLCLFALANKKGGLAEASCCLAGLSFHYL